MLANIVADPRPVDLSALRFSPLATEAGYEGLPAWSSDGQTIAYAAEVNGILQIFIARAVPRPGPPLR
jgi:Tol biopolymer transport system component